MNVNLRLVAILAFIAAVALAAWMFRYDAKPSVSTTTIVTDRWTGAVYRCGLYVKGLEKGCERQF
jgi:hypothetical protein